MKPKPRLERHEQRDGVQLLRTLGAAVYVLGTVRAKGDHPGTRQTPGLADVEAFLPAPPYVIPVLGSVPRGVLLKWECKRTGGRLRPEQAAYRDECLRCGVAHVVGDLTALMAWLVSAGYLRRESLPHERHQAVVIAEQDARAKAMEGR